MSSGLRSSEELNSAVEKWAESDKGDYEENEDVLHDAEEDGDVFEDAATGQQQQQQQQKEEEERGGSQQVKGAPTGVSPVRVRAPISDEREEEAERPDEEDDAGEEDDGGEEEDGEGSFVSGESFGSALERMAGSSTASYDAASSPKATSPVGSLSGRHSSTAGQPVPMNVSQQGALMRLNEMLNGEPSLDTFVIDNSTEKEFKERIAELAESLGQSVNDASFASIEDALLPLVLAGSGPKFSETENSIGENGSSQDIDEEPSAAESPMPKAKLTAEDDADEESREQSVVENEDENGDEEVDNNDENGDDGEAKVDYENGDEEEVENDDEEEVEYDDESGDHEERDNSEDGELVEVQVKQETEQEASEIYDSEQAPKEIADSVPEINGGPHKGSREGDEDEDEPEEVEPGEATSLYGNGEEVHRPTTVRAMPTAKLSAEDDGGSEEREEAEDRDDGGSEEREEAEEDRLSNGPVQDDTEDVSEENDEGEKLEDVPLKIRAALSDAYDDNERAFTDHLEDKAVPEANGYEKEDGGLPDVDLETTVQPTSTTDTAETLKTRDFEPTEEVTGTEDFPEEPEDILAGPIATFAEDAAVSTGKDDETSNGKADGTAQEVSSIDEQSGSPEAAGAVSGNPDEEFANMVRPEVALGRVSENKSVETEAPGSLEVLDEDTSKAAVPESGEVLGEDTSKAAAPVSGEVLGEDTSKAADGWTEGEEIREISSENKSEEDDERVPVDVEYRAEADEAGNSDDESEEEDEEDGDPPMERSPALAGEAGIPSLGAAGPSLPALPVRPVRAGRPSVPSLEPSPRVVQQPRSSGGAPAQSSSSVDDSQTNGEAADGNEETREKLQVIRVKFLRLALRLGQSAHNVVVAQVLYRLGLAEQLRGGRSNNRNAAYSFDRASAIAEEQEAAGPEELDFTCTIMLLGKTGVGKSATINSIFDEPKTGTNAFSPSTKKVQVITGLVHGIKVRVIDTPGLLPSVADQRRNEKVMASVKGFIKKQSPDIVLYFDRLDMQSRDYGDLPLLRTITDTFGAAVWFNAIVVLTHASSAPPDGPNGLPLSYEMFVAQRSHVVQQTIRQAAGDMRLMNPVSLVENHPACRMNRARQRVLPNGQVWKPQLLLLCFASKILAEANSLLKLQDSTPGRPFGARPRVPPLPFLLSSLLQSRAQLKLPDEQVGEDDESDEELEEEEDSDEEEDYDQLPPFRRLSKEEVAELDEDNRQKYFEELAERERLFQKKQWKEELKRRRELKKRMAEAARDESQLVEEGLEDDMARSAAVPVPMPDMVLPPSFDSDNPGHRYRYLETANQWIVRPVLETHGWDHDCGYDGMSLEKMFVIGDNIPASVSGQVTKDKKEANINMEMAASIKHGEGKVTLAGLDFQTVGKDLAYTLRSETRFSNFKGNKTTGGLALTLLGDTISAGMKIEDRLVVGKRLKLVVNGGAITGRGDVAYGGSLEATLRDKDFPLSRTLSTLGLSIMDWHGDLAIGGNLQSQFVLGKTMVLGRANLNNRGAGQISIRASSSEQLQMALIGLLPILRSIANRLFGSQSQQ